MKASILYLLLISVATAQLESPKPPVPEAVPEPTVREPPPRKVDNKGALTGNEPTEMGTIKGEKKLKDSSCKVIFGKVFCRKKKNKPKSVDKLPDA